MTELAWIETAITAARPQAVGALLRYFRDLDTAEEAFQDACLRALKNWPQNGPPRDPAAWLIMVGRNAALDQKRKTSRLTDLPDEDALSDTDDVEAPLAERLDASNYQDDVLRLMFICCHPDLPPVQQVALALRIISGLSVAQIARAFLVKEKAMEQRITRAKARVAKGAATFETPGPVERSERLGAVMAMIYLVFNEGYSAADDPGGARLQLCDEAIRLGRLLLRMFNSEPELQGLVALMLLQHARTPARADNDGNPILLEDQDRSLWNRDRIAEGLGLIDKAMRHRRPGPYQLQAAIAAMHARAATADDTDWQAIAALYEALEAHQPSPVVTLNRAVAVAKGGEVAAAVELTDPLAEKLDGYFYYHGVRGWLFKELGRTREARDAWNRAIGLAHTAAEAAHIRAELDGLERQKKAG